MATRAKKGNGTIFVVNWKKTHIETHTHPFPTSAILRPTTIEPLTLSKILTLLHRLQVVLEQFQAIFRNPSQPFGGSSDREAYEAALEIRWGGVLGAGWMGALDGGWGERGFVGFRFRCFKWFRRKILVEMDVMVGEIGKNKIQLWPVDDPWAVHQVQFLTSIPCPARPQHMTVSWKRTGEYEAHWHHCNF